MAQLTVLKISDYDEWRETLQTYCKWNGLFLLNNSNTKTQKVVINKPTRDSASAVLALLHTLQGLEIEFTIVNQDL